MQKQKYKYFAQKCDRPDGTITMVHSSSMLHFNWGYTQFSQFNTDDTLLLVSGVYLGSNQIKFYFHSSSGEIAVICLENYTLLSCVRNKPYDVFGCWLNETHLVSGNLHWIGNMTSCSVLWLNKAFQCLVVRGRAVSIPGSDATSQDALDGAAVEPFEDLRTHAKSFQSPEGECPLHDCPPRNLKLSTCSTAAPSMRMGDKTYLLFTTGSLTYFPHQIGIKRIMPDQMIMSGPVLGEESSTDKFFDSLDHVIGMGLSPDHRYLYVNSRAWLAGWVISDPMSPHPIAEEIDLHAHRAFTPNEECFFIFLDVSRDFVASGAEDKHGYIWDHHHNICLARLQHDVVVNSVAFSPTDLEQLLSASDDSTIKVWHSARPPGTDARPSPAPSPG
uniref:F-box and WD repeat domain containing 5 n=1 Tax=Oncorhynchus tshawytscha TaxID=74940 RepID=A0AAZ3Q0N0_ONCTS